MAERKLDLHCHTYYSDGTESPRAVVERAVRNGVTHLAITDHDCAAVMDEVPQDIDISLISGVEISCHWNSIELHVVGLFVDHENEQLHQLLTEQQQARTERVHAMAEKLEALGTSGLSDYLASLPCKAYTRSHVANYLVAAGVSKTRQKAFKTHLAKGGKIFVGSQWCELETCIKTIHAAGGIAVLAHPGRYPLNKRRLSVLVEEFAELGGDALEARYPNINPQTIQLLERLAYEAGILLSEGSDFHDPAAHWTDVGKFLPIRGEALERSVCSHTRWRD